MTWFKEDAETTRLYERIEGAEVQITELWQHTAADFRRADERMARLENQLQMLLLASGFEIVRVPEVPAVPARNEIQKSKKGKP